MRKQEVFILLVTTITWLITLRGRPFIGLVYYQLYTALGLSNVFRHLEWIRLPYTTGIVTLFSLILHARRIVFSRQTILMVLLLVAMCLSRLVNGLDPTNTLYVGEFLKYIFVNILIISIVDSKEKLKYFLWIFIISACTLAVVSLYNNTFTPYIWMDRNDFAALLTSVIVFPVFFGLAERRLAAKAELMVYFSVLLMGIIATNSRGAYLALIVIMALIVMANLKVRRLLVLAFVLMLVLPRVSSIHWERMRSISFDTEQEGTGGQRIAAWKTALRIIAKNPILGVGTGEFPVNFKRYATLKDYEKVKGEFINTHNTILQVGSEVGLVGLVLFLLITYFSFKDVVVSLKLCRGDPKLADVALISKCIGASLTGYILTSLFLNYAYNLHLYTLISISVAMKRIAEKESLCIAESSQVESEKSLKVYYPEFVLRTMLLGISILICLQL